MMRSMDDGKENLVYDIMVSSTVPAKSTGEGMDREFNSMDLAMKLHYVKAVYFFESGSVKGLRLQDFKDPTFWWLRVFYMACGRVRRHPDTGGRPFLKCNDGGIRCIEAQCSKTVAEWLAMEDHQSIDHLLVYHQPLGPHLFFSPLVYLQITWFKCGGVSLGLSWAHILGDAFSAVAFANLYGQSLSGNQPEQLSLTAKVDTEKSKPLPPIPFAVKPMPAKRVGPVADHWAVPDSGRKMGTHSFHVTATQLQQLLAQVTHAAEAAHDDTQSLTFTPFEVLAALIWKSLVATATSEGDRLPPLAVTICQTDSHRGGNEVPRNAQRLRVVEAPEEVETEWWELAQRIAAGKKDPRDLNGAIEEMVEEEDGNVDLVVYGANLTFVNMEEAEVYGMEIKGHRPVRASYSMNGVGDNGVVLVLPSPPGDVGGGGGRTVSVTMPGDQLVRLKSDLSMRL